MSRLTGIFILIGLLIVSLAVWLITAPTAHAATLTVTNLNDSGANSLRDAITIAMASPTADTIKFSVSGTIVLTTSLPTITSAGGALTIDGAGQTITISGNNSVRVFKVDSSAALTLNDLTVANGNASNGAGVFNSGAFTVTNSTFSGNASPGNAVGGGIYTNDGTVSISNSTFFSNTSTGTFGGGGAIYSSGTTVAVTITNSTFSGNSITSGAGGNAIGHNPGLPVTLYNTIVANNTGGDGNCNSGITNGGNNIDDGSTCGWGSSNGSMSDTNPRLGSLANNGGPTRTMALLPGSPAIDGVIFNAPNGCPSTDQRGTQRPIGLRCDIGAYEAIYLFLPLILK